MRIYPDQLERHLTNLPQTVLLFGDDPWLIEKARSQIQTQAKNTGFDERIKLTQETNFNWFDLQDQWNAMSLFASKRLIELHLPTAKPGAEGAKMLQSLIEQPNSDILLLITGTKLTADQTRAKWFKALEKQGFYIPCTTPEGTQFVRWLNQRINYFNLNLTPNAHEMLINLYEGNLLAADQALQLLQLLSPNQQISSQQLTAYFEDQSRFTLFQLIDTLLLNQQDKAQHIIKQLQAEGVALPVILWGIFKELTTLIQLKSAQDTGEHLATLWRQYRIWDKRQPLYQQALSRLSLTQLEQLLACASKIEINLKQHGIEDWTAVSHLALLFDSTAHQALSYIDFNLTTD